MNSSHFEDLTGNLREFRSEAADDFFAPCNVAATAARAPARAASAAPFQCEHPARPFRFEDFR